jgi:ATP-dependent RNA helicase DHX8/PRP22
MPHSHCRRSLELLYALGALDGRGELNGVGQQLVKLPVEPMYGKVLLAAAGMGCLSEALAVVSMLSSESVFHMPRAKEEAWRAARLKFTSR